MQQINEILNFIKKDGLNVLELSRKTGISSDKIYKWRRGEGKPKYEDALILAKHINKKVAEVPHGTLQEPEEDFTVRSTKLRLSLKHGTKSVPVTNGKAAAGTVALINDEPELILEYIDAPFLGIVEGVVECVGHSMYPIFPNGCRLAIKKLEDKALFNPGEFYFIIDNNYEGYVKRLYEDAEGVILVSENADQKKYPPFKRKWEHIVALFKVKADITKH